MREPAREGARDVREGIGDGRPAPWMVGVARDELNQAGLDQASSSDRRSVAEGAGQDAVCSLACPLSE